RHTIRLVCGFNEEAGMKDVEHYLAHHTPPEYTLVCDGGWAMCIGEKGILNADLVRPLQDGNLISLQAGTAHNAVPGSAEAVLSGADAAALTELARQYPGITVQAEDALVRIVSEGQAAHAAFPWSGKNAIHPLMRFLADSGAVHGDAGAAVKELSALFSDDYGSGLGIAFEDEQSGKTTCVDSVLQGTVEQIRLHIDCRFAVTQSGDQLTAQLQRACAAHSISLENLTSSNPRYTDPQAPITKMLLDTVHEFLGDEYEPYTMGGGTHARKFPNALPYGPGGIRIENPFGFPHGIDEAVSIESLLMSMSTYAVALKRLDEALPV
ncbi:MAG: M20/M25/M40 family metallo-hydrolase, partial [Clostridia bacterium]|nr:M20/M25/M40 family metallo-hydrolase [Clostridia bacterium]